MKQEVISSSESKKQLEHKNEILNNKIDLLEQKILISGKECNKLDFDD